MAYSKDWLLPWSAWAYFYPDYGPANAAWLTAEEKYDLSAVLAAEGRGRLTPEPHGLLASSKDPTAVLFIAIYILLQMSVAIVVFYLLSQVGAAGLSGIRSRGWPDGRHTLGLCNCSRGFAGGPVPTHGRRRKVADVYVRFRKANPRGWATGMGAIQP